jgi:uncharacterized protein YndB with AHSA1/START domain
MVESDSKIETRNKSMQDTIERQITIRAPKEGVYNAITDPKQITSWFPQSIDGDLEVGSRPIIDFGKDHRYQLYVEAANPYDYFAYRWVPANEDESIGFIGDVKAFANTLVEFKLTEDSKGTTVSLKESGFASLPPTVAAKQLEQNSGGWDYMLDRLEKLFSGE